MTRFTVSVRGSWDKSSHMLSMSITSSTRKTKLGLDYRVKEHVVLLGFVLRVPWRALLAVWVLQKCTV